MKNKSQLIYRCYSVNDMEFTYCKLIDVLRDIHSGGTPSTEEPSYWGGNIKWLSSGETGQRFIRDTVDKITQEGIMHSSTKLAKKHNVVMACAGQGKTRGQTSFLLDDMYINQSVIALQPKQQVLPLYLFYDLSSRYDELRGGSDASSTRGSITTTALKNLPFKYPDLATQQSIVNILYTYDELIENNNRRIALLEKAAQELYKEWFVRFRFPGHETAKFENGLPEGWMVMRVKDLVKRYPFGTLYKGDSILSEGKTIVIDQSANEYAGFHNNEPSHIANIDRPIILFGDHTCKYQLMTIPFSLSENVVPFTGAEAVETTYLYYLVNGIVETTEYKRHWTEFVSKKVLVADNKVQRLFREKIKDSLLLIESLKLQNRNLIKQRDLLLPRLMSGKLEV